MGNTRRHSQELVSQENTLDKQSPTRQRLPRYHTGSQAAALSNLWQTEARFEVRLHPETRSLGFVYSFSAPANIPADCESLYDALFSGYRVELEQRLQDALKSRTSGRPVTKYIDQIHHRAIQDAISEWFRELYTSVPEKNAKSEIEKFTELAPKRSGPDAQLALIVRERFLEIRASIKFLRKTVQPNLLDRSDESALIEKIEKSGLRLEAVKRALRALFDDPEMKTVKPLFFGGRFTPTVLTSSIVESELALDNRNPLNILARTYVNRANQLLNALRDPGQPRVTPDKKA